MKSPATTSEQRQLLVTARAYRRNGYQVLIPERGDPIPAFLDGLKPDLVAQRDDDHVVIEIKRADVVAGSNDIVELAQAVAPRSGWRFELIAVPTLGRVQRPDLTSVSMEASRLLALDFAKAAFLVTFAAIENLLASAAVLNGINPADAPLAALARDLVVRGLLSRDVYDEIIRWAAFRNASVHGRDTDSPTKRDVETLIALSKRLEDDVLAQVPA